MIGSAMKLLKRNLPRFSRTKCDHACTGETAQTESLSSSVSVSYCRYNNYGGGGEPGDSGLPLHVLLLLMCVISPNRLTCIQ